MKYKIKNNAYILKEHTFEPGVFYEGTLNDGHFGEKYVILNCGKQIEGFYLKEVISEKEEHENKFNKKIDEILDK